MEETIYVWTVDLEDGNTGIFFARSEHSLSDAVDRISLKVAGQAYSPETIFNIDRILRSHPPMKVDFAEGVGALILRGRI